MIRSRGFSLLEIMLALVVVAIGISVLLAFSASNQRETNSESAGNDYSLLVNDMLEQYIPAVSDCSSGVSCATLSTMYSACPPNTPCSVRTYFSKAGITLSTSQVDALKAAGIDIDKITVSITPKRGDVLPT